MVFFDSLPFSVSLTPMARVTALKHHLASSSCTPPRIFYSRTRRDELCRIAHKTPASQRCSREGRVERTIQKVMRTRPADCVLGDEELISKLTTRRARRQLTGVHWGAFRPRHIKGGGRSTLWSHRITRKKQTISSSSADRTLILAKDDTNTCVRIWARVISSAS